MTCINILLVGGLLLLSPAIIAVAVVLNWKLLNWLHDHLPKKWQDWIDD